MKYSNTMSALFCGALFSGLIFGCGSSAPKTKATSGEAIIEVPFIKLSNPSFLSEYENRSVSTTAVLQKLSSPGMLLPKKGNFDGYAQFTLVDQDNTVSVGGLIKKASSEEIFSLKPGSKLRVMGTCRAHKFTGGLAHIWIVIHSAEAIE